MEIDLSRPKGDRITSLKMLCSRCTVPKYEEIDDNMAYNTTMQSYLAGGGDGYKFLQDGPERSRQ